MSQTTPAAGQVRVLFVDDEQEFALVVSKRLRRLGLEVGVAHNGADALRLARDQEYDVAVLDLKMAGMDGLEVLRTLLILMPQIRAIILTGHGSSQMAKECLDAGAYCYLNKPCDFGKLVDHIQKAAARIPVKGDFR